MSCVSYLISLLFHFCFLLTLCLCHVHVMSCFCNGIKYMFLTLKTISSLLSQFEHNFASTKGEGLSIHVQWTRVTLCKLKVQVKVLGINAGRN